MPKGVYTKRAIMRGDDRRSVTDKSAYRISDAQKEILFEAIENDYTVAEACAQAHMTTKTFYNYFSSDEDFKMRVEWARTKLIRDAKDRVHDGVLKDKDGEFSLKVLKARCPEQYNTQKIETKNEVKAEVEHRDVDDMLVEYYAEE